MVVVEEEASDTEGRARKEEALSVEVEEEDVLSDEEEGWKARRGGKESTKRREGKHEEEKATLGNREKLGPQLTDNARTWNGAGRHALNYEEAQHRERSSCMRTTVCL